MMLEKKIMKFGTALDMTIYVDGLQAVKKSETSEARKQTRPRALERTPALDSFESRLNSGSENDISLIFVPIWRRVLIANQKKLRAGHRGAIKHSLDRNRFHLQQVEDTKPNRSGGYIPTGSVVTGESASIISYTNELERVEGRLKTFILTTGIAAVVINRLALLGYVVARLNGYTSKRCSKCEQLVAQMAHTPGRQHAAASLNMTASASFTSRSTRQTLERT
ncbi:MAG: hypothetical protein J3R72DRAFT_502374 [Linnemannia gamsii]|nr:MAG: hypothetical protein J3R72DRAFT_502374 [Linnemannia gamsii]